MSDSIIRSNEASEAEAWLMPEIGGAHIVRFDRQREAGGYKTQTKSPPKKTSKYLTERQLDELVTESREQAEQQGFEQGRKNGYEQGYAEGQAKGRELIEDYKARMQQLLDGVASQVQNQMESDRENLQQAVVQLVTAISEQVCFHELSQTQPITDIVRRALAGLPASEKSATLSVNAEDFSLLENVPEFNLPHIKLQADQSIARGGCKITSEHSHIDFTVENRVGDIVKEYFAKTEAGE